MSVVLRGRLLQISVGVTGTLHSARFISLCFFFNFFPLRSAVREKRGEIKEKTTERITGRCCPRLRDVYAKRRGFFETGPARGNENARRSIPARFARRGNVSDAIPASCRSGRRRCREGTRPRLAGVEPEKETVVASARGSCRVWEVVSDVRVCLKWLCRLVIGIINRMHVYFVPEIGRILCISARVRTKQQRRRVV